ncbi:MAG: sulfotransferase domain-containing protein [Pirellulaceae bacterium]|nr:sulfotransferase domain-containing protein [Pirellulaceae bacterium]
MKQAIRMLLRTLSGRPKTSAESDVYIVSYPKSGRTWLRALIGKYLSLKYEIPEDLILSTESITTKSGLPKVSFTHAGTEMGSDSVGPPKDLSRVRHKRSYNHVILLGRDVKDILVSSYFQATKRSFLFTGTISEFIATRRFGVLRILEFYDIWLRTRHLTDSFLFIRYEQLHQNPQATLARVLNFIGENDIDDNTLEQSVEYCAFDKLRKLEAQGRFKESSLRTRNPEDPESYKTRRGEIGGYTEFLSEADQRFIDEAIKAQKFDFDKLG